MFSRSLFILLFTAHFTFGATPAPVADAAERGNLALVRSLIQQHVNVNGAQADGMTPLHWAAMRDDAELAQLLIDAKATLDPVTRLGAYTPLYLAAKNGSASVAELLLKAGADINRTSGTGATVLMVAAAAGSTRIVEALLIKEANVDAREATHGQTALMFAAAANRSDVIRVLIKHGANPETTSSLMDPGCGSTFARSLCGENNDRQQDYEKPSLEKLNELVEPAAAGSANADKPKEPAPRKEGSAGSTDETALQTRLANLRKEVSKLSALIDDLEKKAAGESEKRHGATVMGGTTPLLFAARGGHIEAVRALVEQGAKVDNAGNGEKMTPLVMAIVNGHFDVAQYLLERNADPNLANIEGLTALYAAIDMQWAPYAWRPQPIAAQENTSYLELMKSLVEHGANPNARLTHRVWFRALPGDNTWVDPAGATAFWRAAQAVDLPAMQLLVKAGADPKLPTYEGVTPLMVASGLGWATNFSRNAPNAWIDAVKYCLELGLDVKAKSRKGYTALHGTAFIGNNDLIQFLVQQGADPTVVATDKNTVADMANGPFPHSVVRPETIALLEKLGSKNSNNCRADTCLVVTNKKQD